MTSFAIGLVIPGAGSIEVPPASIAFPYTVVGSTIAAQMVTFLTAVEAANGNELPTLTDTLTITESAANSPQAVALSSTNQYYFDCCGWGRGVRSEETSAKSGWWARQGSNL